MRELTKHQIDRIRKLHSQGLSSVTIAERLNIDRATVWRYFKKLDLKPNAKQWYRQYDGDVA